MNPRVVREIFNHSESKNIDVWCDGKLAIQYHRTTTEVTDEGNGTISVENKTNGSVTYIDTCHISTIWVKKDKPKDDVFI